MSRSMYDTTGLEPGVQVRTPEGTGRITAVAYGTPVSAGYVKVLQQGNEREFRADDVEIEGKH